MKQRSGHKIAFFSIIPSNAHFQGYSIYCPSTYYFSVDNFEPPQDARELVAGGVDSALRVEGLVLILLVPLPSVEWSL